MSKRAFAVAAHPDDIEFMMAGALYLLGQAGYQLHYMNIANGSCGSATVGAKEIAAIRSGEAKKAAMELGAEFHPPLVDDLQIYYRPELTARLCAIVRDVQPEILLLPSPDDYMEDHMNTSRLMVTAAFCRNMANFPTSPPSEPVQNDMAVYHALSYGLKDQLRRLVIPDFYVNIESVLDVKRQALACHRSQKEWLDVSQGANAYLNTMQTMSADVGQMSEKFKFAEGWRRHSHLGFGAENFDPLCETLNKWIHEKKTGEQK